MSERQQSLFELEVYPHSQYHHSDLDPPIKDMNKLKKSKDANTEGCRGTETAENIKECYLYNW